MVNFVLLSIAFSAGIVSFLNPCGIAMLPAFISYELGKKKGEKGILPGIKMGLLIVFGFILVFGVTGMLVALVGRVIGEFVPYIAIALGVVLIILGFMVFLKKSISISIPTKLFNKFKNPTSKQNETIFLFGIGYGLAALGCTFPIFLIVVSQALSAGSFIDSLLTFAAYIIGMSVLMIPIAVAITTSRKFFVEKLLKAVPIITQLSGVVLIIAGLYLIQLNLVAL